MQPRGRPGAAKPAISISPVTTDSGTAKPAIAVTTDSEPATPTSSASICEPFRAAIELGLQQGRNAMGIWQDLVSHAGFGGGYQTVKRFVRKLRGALTPQAVRSSSLPLGRIMVSAASW